MRAEALAQRGEHAAALALARAAVELAAATDDLLDHADARIALAAALRAVGRSAEADSEASRAIELWEAKGATLLVERARRIARSVEPLLLRGDRTDRARGAPRRVRPNAATATMERLGAAFASGDAVALAGLFAEDYESLEHPIGAALGREEVIGSLHAMLRTSAPRLRYESLASLGESFDLSRRWWSSEATSGGAFDVAASEREVISVVEVDERARFRWGEIFAPDRLGDAIARMYQRYADRFPDGPARERAAATARSAAAYLGPWAPDRYETAFAPSIEVVDHRILGTWSTQGAEALLQNVRGWLSIADSIAIRQDDVLALRSDALLGRRTFLGTDHAGGGSFERTFLQLWVFGSDGLLTRLEYFDADREAEALARFDELTAEPAAERFANTAARVVDASLRAMARRDWDALVALHAPGHVFDDRRSLLRTRVEGEAYLAHLRILFRERPDESRELLATRGDRLALHRGHVHDSRWRGRPRRVRDAQSGRGGCFWPADRARDLRPRRPRRGLRRARRALSRR